jgi:hypothetical protein
MSSEMIMGYGLLIVMSAMVIWFINKIVSKVA